MSVPKAPGSSVKSLIFFEESGNREYAYRRGPEVFGDLRASKMSLDFPTIDDRCRDIALPMSIFGISTGLAVMADVVRVLRKMFHLAQKGELSSCCG